MKLRVTYDDLMESLENTVSDMDPQARELAFAAQAELASPGEWAAAETTTMVDPTESN